MSKKLTKKQVDRLIRKKSINENLILNFNDTVVPELLDKVSGLSLRDLYRGIVKGDMLSFWMLYDEPNYLEEENNLTNFQKYIINHPNYNATKSVLTFTDLIINVNPILWLVPDEKSIDILFYIFTTGKLKGYDGWPIPISRKMLHVFNNLEPNECSREHLFLYCFMKTQGYSKIFFRRLSRFIDFRDFDQEYNQQHLTKWEPVIRNLWEWNVINLIPDSWDLEKFLGFINHKIQEMNDFSFKNRTLQNLIDASDRYYEELEALELEALALEDELNLRRRRGEEEEGYFNIFEYELFPDFGFKEWELSRGEDRYVFLALNSYKKLLKESNEMSHCVHTYAYKCLDGKFSIWSLQKYNVYLQKWQSLVTIQLSKYGTIMQAKSMFNGTPSATHMEMIKEWIQHQGNLV